MSFPYIYLDATYVNVRDDALGQVVSRAVVIATGITAKGAREVLGVDIGDSEDETFWTRFLRSLRTPGPGRGAPGEFRRQVHRVGRHRVGRLVAAEGVTGRTPGGAGARAAARPWCRPRTC